MERLRRRHRIGGSVRERDRLGASGQGSRARDSPLELPPHLPERLDRDHTVTERKEPPRQLPGAGAEIDDVAWLLADEPANRLRRIFGPTSLVGPGDVREGRVRAAHLRVAIDDHSEISTTPSRRATSLGTTSSTLSRAQNGMSGSSSGAFSRRLRPLLDARNASSALLQVDARRSAATAESVRSQPRSSTIRPATKASSSASVPLTPAHTTTTSSCASSAAATTAERLS